jgi:electron transfer flavoprotein alpha subunit
VADLVVSQPGNVLAGRGPAERVWLGAAAAALDAPVLTGVAELGLVDGQVVAVREVGGGIGQETVAFDGLVCVMTEGRRPVEPLAGPQDSARAEVAQLAAGFYPMTVLQATPAPGPGVDLAAAKLVVGAGRGFACQGDLALAERLADAMGAAVACSRPLAEGLGWLPKDRYVGISGMQIAPDLYLAVGISGQLQHMGGVRGAGTIVAINKDPGAPIMAQADYVLAGDLYELLPALTAAVAGEQR